MMRYRVERSLDGTGTWVVLDGWGDVVRIHKCWGDAFAFACWLANPVGAA